MFNAPFFSPVPPDNGLVRRETEIAIADGNNRSLSTRFHTEDRTIVALRLPHLSGHLSLQHKQPVDLPCLLLLHGLMQSKHKHTMAQ